MFIMHARKITCFETFIQKEAFDVGLRKCAILGNLDLQSASPLNPVKIS